MYEVDDFLCIKRLKSLHKALHAAPGLHRLAHVPGDDFLRVAVCNHREIAEGVAAVCAPDGYIRNVRDPYLVLAYGYDVLHQIGIGGQSVSGVRRTRAPPWSPHVQIVPGYDGLHLVPAHHILVVCAEALTVHVVQLFAAHAGIKPAYVLYKLDNHFFLEPLLA